MLLHLEPDEVFAVAYETRQISVCHPSEASLQGSYCSKHLHHLILNFMMRPRRGGGKKSDNAIATRENTGADTLIDLTILIEGNPHPSEEDHCTHKSDAAVLRRTPVVPKHCASGLHCGELTFSFFLRPDNQLRDSLLLLPSTHQCWYKTQ